MLTSGHGAAVVTGRPRRVPRRDRLRRGHRPHPGAAGGERRSASDPAAGPEPTVGRSRRRRRERWTAAMADATTTAAGRPSPPGAGGRLPGRLRSLPRETVLMLVLPPVLVTLMFLGYVWWRQSADLDSVEQSSGLADRGHADLGARQAHLRLGRCSWSLVAVPLGIALTRGRCRPPPRSVVGIANAGQAAPAIGLIVLLAMWLGLRLLDRRARAGALRRAAGARATRSPGSRAWTARWSRPAAVSACPRAACCCASSCRSPCR